MPMNPKNISQAAVSNDLVEESPLGRMHLIEKHVLLIDLNTAEVPSGEGYSKCDLDRTDRQVRHAKKWSAPNQSTLDPFIPSSLDDAGLTPSQFRVLCHLWRRGQTYSKAATIAKVCKLNRNTVFKILNELKEKKLISREKRPGYTTLIIPLPFEQIGEGNPTRLVAQDTTRLGVQDPTLLGIHKGNPTKATPLRQSKEDLVALPFTSEAFKSAWSEWTTHRVEQRKPITPLSAKKLLSHLETMGEPRAIAAIQHSIANGWQGIFEPKEAATSQAKSKPPTPTKLTWE